MTDILFNDSLGGTEIAPFSSPWNTLSQLYAPKRLKDLFKWCEYLFYNSTQIYAALRKFGEYPITEITYDTTNEALKEKHENLLEKTIRIKRLLVEITLDKYVYGNAFLSMYQPFIRYLNCPHCNTLTNIKNIDYVYSFKKISFKYTCPNCHKTATATQKQVQDKKLKVAKDIHFIRWDPKLMDIDYNPITDESVYYYTLAPSLISRVRSGHKTLIDTLPMGFLEAIKENKQFKFLPGAVYHMKMEGPAGINPQWGLPPLISTLQLFHYTAILRKANEAIASDHLVPLRILHPAQASGIADPVTSMDLRSWREEMDKGIRKWRLDPLHMIFAPVPLGVTQLGGQGRALLTLGEVQEAEKNIVSALGIPQEFLYGGLTGQGMEATLRMIENQLATHISQLKEALQWISNCCARFLGWQRVETDFTPFRMTDDMNKKNMILQLYSMGVQTGNKIISDTTIAELHDIDLSAEEERIKQETLDTVRRQHEIQIEVEKLQNNAAQQAQQQAAGGTPYNPMQVMQQADGIVQQLMQMDPGLRKSQLEALKVEDYVMYSVVIQRLEQATQTVSGQAITGGM